MKRAPLNPLDRVIGWFSPTAGLQRWRARTMMALADGSWKGGRKDRRPTRNWRPGGGSPDADTLRDLPDVRARARDLARNAPIATGAVKTTVTGVVGAGLQLQASIDAEILGITPEQADAAEREQEREFWAFSKRCDFTGVQCFDELQVLAFRSVKESGDCVIVRRFRKDPGDLYGTKMQVIEADRLSNPNRGDDTDRLSGGVETNADGVPIGYHISDKHPGALRIGQLIWERVPARSDDGLRVVIHLFHRDRPELSRGMPLLAPVVEHLKQLSDYSDAEVTAAVVGAMVTMVIESPAGTGGDGDVAPIIGEQNTMTAENEMQLGNGAVLGLAPGEKASMMNPSRPNSNFDPFVTAFLTQVGVALGLPLELLTQHFSSSYSASRAALEIAWAHFNGDRVWFAERFCQEVYGWAMDEAVAMGRINRPGWFANPLVREAYLGANWIGPRRYSLNPFQEAQADKLDMETGVKTGEQVCMERTGGEIEKKLDQRAKEMGLAKAAGLVVEPTKAAAPGDTDETDDTEKRGAA